jgi:mycothiol-dependent nitroreductase-like protein
VARGHAEAQRRAGIKVGSPLATIDNGQAFFGSVLARRPDPGEADRIFDGVAALVGCGSFSELKGSRS